MAGRPSGQGLLHGGSPSTDPEAHSPGGHSNAESFTGWPWSVRHDYKQLQMDGSSQASNTSSLPSRNASWGNQDDYDAGLPANSSLRRLQQGIILVIFINALLIAIECAVISREDARRVLKVLELLVTVIFMLLLVCMVRAEVTKMEQKFCAKQAIAEADRKDEMLRIVRADLISFREASLRQKAEADKDVADRFASMDKEFARALSKADTAAAYAIEQISSVRQDVLSVRGMSETAQTVASAAAGCIEDFNRQLAALKSATDACAEKLGEHNGALQRLAPGDEIFISADKATPSPDAEKPVADSAELTKEAGDGPKQDEAADEKAGAPEATENEKQAEEDESTIPSTAAEQGEQKEKVDEAGAKADEGGPANPDTAP